MIPLIGNRKMSKKRLFILKILEKPKTNHLKRNSKETKFKNVIKIKLIGVILNFVNIKLLFSTVLDILDLILLLLLLLFPGIRPPILSELMIIRLCFFLYLYHKHKL